MGDYYEIDDINKGRACVTAATNAISHISGRLMQIPTSKLTWSSAYTVFISTLTLLVAAAFAHPNERHAIHGTIQIAIHILQSTTYGSSYCKKSYLDFIQVSRAQVRIGDQGTDNGLGTLGEGDDALQLCYILPI